MKVTVATLEGKGYLGIFRTLEEAKAFFVTNGCLSHPPKGMRPDLPNVLGVTRRFKEWMALQGFSLYQCSGTVEEWYILLEEVEVGKVVQGWNE